MCKHPWEVSRLAIPTLSSSAHCPPLLFPLLLFLLQHVVGSVIIVRRRKRIDGINKREGTSPRSLFIAPIFQMLGNVSEMLSGSGGYRASSFPQHPLFGSPWCQGVDPGWHGHLRLLPLRGIPEGLATDLPGLHFIQQNLPVCPAPVTKVSMQEREAGNQGHAERGMQ